MRFLSAILLLGLTAPSFADAPPKLGLRVVRVMPESGQALLFDKNHDTHVLIEVGKRIEGYTVTDIDEDEVTLTAEGSSMILAAPAVERQHVAPAKKPAVAAVKADPTPADPYGEPAPEAAPRVAEAPTPVAAGDGGVRVVTPAGTPAPIVTPSLKIDPAVATVVPPDAPAKIEQPAVVEDAAITLAKPDVAKALADFGKLATAAKGGFTPEGLRLDRIAPDSLYAHAGLHDGDTVTAVDGKPLHSIDDAADLYARAGAIKTATVSVLRGGKPITLRVAIQ
jgi:hypothetical protein